MLKAHRLQKKNLVKYKFLKVGIRILDILKVLVHLRFWRLSYENNIFTSKKTHWQSGKINPNVS